ncbi:MAG: energy transducer TonB [Niabella sp.]
MKKTVILPELLVVALFMLVPLTGARAQNKMYVYYLNENMEIVPKEKALVVGKGMRRDSVFLMQYYTAKSNRLFMVESYKDSTLAVAHGIREKYHPDRKKAETAEVFNNQLRGVSQKWDSAGHLTDSAIYDSDKLLYEKKMRYTQTGYLFNTKITDNIKETMVDTDYDSTGNKLREVSFIADHGIWTEFKEDGTITSVDSVFTREEENARFPGKNGWQLFLVKNLDGSVPIRNGATGGHATVVVQFIVEKDGTLTNMKALTNNGYGTEEEVLRLLKKSPKWIPAKRYGRAVKAYRKQPVTFQIHRN